jgi:ferredoxin
MKRMRVVLRFPDSIVEKPVTYHLIADYDIRVNILRASIDPGKQGMMVVELAGEEPKLQKGLAYLRDTGVQVDPLAKEVRPLEDRCTSCTSCVPHCPVSALEVDRKTWKVSFAPEKCIVCLSCLDTCIYRAMSIIPDILYGSS